MMIPSEQNFSWYVIRVASAKEDSYGKQIEAAFNESKLKDSFAGFMVPKKIDFKYVNGEQKQIDKAAFPGYIFLNLKMSIMVLNYLKKTLKFTNILGSKSDQVDSISDEEFQAIIAKLESSNKEAVAFDNDIKIGSKVQIISGSFSSLDGFVQKIIDNTKAIVLIRIFGRDTEVETEVSNLKLVN